MRRATCTTRSSTSFVRAASQWARRATRHTSSRRTLAASWPSTAGATSRGCSSSWVTRTPRRASARQWTAPEAEAYPGETQGGVLLAGIEEWDPPVPMEAVVARIDPTGSNPYVQANAKDGFQNGVVEITDQEYEAVLAVRAELVA